MKKLICSLAFLIGVTVMSSNAFAADPSLRTRANQRIFMGEEKVLMHISGPGIPTEVAIAGTLYKSKFVSLRDLFGPTTSTINWDEKSKIATVSNHGKKMLLNFSSDPVIPQQGEVVVPRTWIKMQDGKTMIDIYVLAYILDQYGGVDRNGEKNQDLEREQWNEKLNFLGIKDMQPLPEVKARLMHIYVTLS